MEVLGTVAYTRKRKEPGLFLGDSACRWYQEEMDGFAQKCGIPPKYSNYQGHLSILWVPYFQTTPYVRNACEGFCVSFQIGMNQKQAHPWTMQQTVILSPFIF